MVSGGHDGDITPGVGGAGVMASVITDGTATITGVTGSTGGTCGSGGTYLTCQSASHASGAAPR